VQKKQETFANDRKKLTSKSTFCNTMENDEAKLICIYLFLNPIVQLLLFCLYMSVIPIKYVYTNINLGKKCYIFSQFFLCSDNLIAQLNGIMKYSFRIFKSEK